MKKNYFLQVLLLLIASSVFLSAKAQNNYSKCYLVTIEGDTLKGFIQDKDWSRNPKTIRYKKEIDATQVIEYTPAQLHSFYIEATNDYYISYIGKVDASPIKSNQLMEVTEDSDFLQKDHAITDSVFLNVLSVGAVSLYFYKDRQQKEHFFFRKGNESLTELVFQKYLKNLNDGQKFIREVRQYRGQLTENLSECTKVIGSIGKATYTKQALSYIVNTYNECFSAEPTYKKPYEKTKLAIGILTGITRTSFRHYYQGKDIDYKDSYNPVLGLSFNFVLPRNHNVWSVYSDIFWKSYSTKAVVTTQNSFERILKVSEVKTNILVRYTLPVNGIKPFINVGSSGTLLVNAEGNILTNSYQDKAEFDKFMFGLQGGIGVSYKKFTLEMRYERTRSVFAGLVTSTSERNLSAFVTYWLK